MKPSTTNSLEIYADGPDDLPDAYSLYYSRLAETFYRIVRPLRPRSILEAGCGKGQLTMPLLEQLPKSTHLIGVDSSRGPYRGWLEDLAHKIQRLRLERQVHLIKSDVQKMKSVGSESVDVLISNELICDLTTSTKLARVLREFYRVLRSGGAMIHGEWSSSQDAKSEDIIVTHSPAWNPDQLASIINQTGFHDINVRYFNTLVKFGPRAAKAELQSWGASSRVKGRILSENQSMRLPPEHIIVASK